MAKILTKKQIENHPLVGMFEPAGDDVPDYKYYIQAAVGYYNVYYMSLGKHCQTLVDCSHFLVDIIEGIPNPNHLRREPFGAMVNEPDFIPKNPDDDPSYKRWLERQQDAISE
jgi:hypothetical protein